MKCTGVGKEKEEFVPRKSKEEFFRDGEMIEELYRLTDGLICNELNVTFHNLTLHVFNYAYRICWMIVAEKKSVTQIDDSMKIESDTERNYSLAVALALLRLNKDFYPTSNHRGELSGKMSKRFFHDRYSKYISEKTVPYPIDFCAPLPEPIDFVNVKNNVMAAMDEAIKLENENKELRRQLEGEKSKREATERTIAEKQAKLDAWESDKFYKAVNINTIFEYAQSNTCSQNNREAIKLTLLALCANKVSDYIIEKIKALECGGNVRIEKQENHGCQNFYGPITDSEFPSK